MDFLSVAGWIVTIGIVSVAALSFLALQETGLGTVHVQDYDWMIGQVIVQTDEKRGGQDWYPYQSTGFLVKEGPSFYFITAAHTVDKIIKEYGRSKTVMAHFRNLPSGAEQTHEIRLLFTEPFEDAAVFEIPGLRLEEPNWTPSVGEYRELEKGQLVYALGFPKSKAHAAKPQRLQNRFLSRVRLRDVELIDGAWQSKEMVLNYKDRDTDSVIELLTDGPIAEGGMSGSPIFVQSSGELVGIFKRSVGITAPEEINVFRPLERTLNRLRLVARALPNEDNGTS